MKRTPWFGALECPVREGVYERKLYDYHQREPLVVYAYWDTKQWYVGGYTPEEAMLLAEKPCPCPMACEQPNSDELGVFEILGKFIVGVLAMIGLGALVGWLA